MLKRICLICSLTFFLIQWVKAEDLVIGVASYTPPFVYKTSTNHYYGFDVFMMMDLCKIIEANCTFTSIPFNELIDAVAKGKVDMAVSAITITIERMERVNFSKPYMPSYCSLLTRSDNISGTVDINYLEKQYYGIRQQDVFEIIIRSMGILNAPIYTYRNDHLLIDSLRKEKISMIMMDTPSAFYWQVKSKGVFKVLGKPFDCGYGFGIAINKNETSLKRRIDEAIDKYHDNGDFKEDYNRFLNFKYLVQ
jgi:polar amino acid transport system substrate-binding protein